MLKVLVELGQQPSGGVLLEAQELTESKDQESQGYFRLMLNFY